MEKLKLSLRCERGVKCPPELRRRIKTAALAVLASEEVAGPCELSVGETDPASGRLLLGDMVLNVDRARSQGEQFGHGAEHEISYLTVHSVLHLLGYDHVDEGPMKRQMRGREKAIMAQLEPDTQTEDTE